MIPSSACQHWSAEQSSQPCSRTPSYTTPRDTIYWLAGASSERTGPSSIRLVCFAGALRQFELVGLDVERLTWATAGLTLLITRLKTDKEGAGADFGIRHGGCPKTCPVEALRRWLGQV